MIRPKETPLPALEVEAVNLSLDGRPVLRDISFRVESGAFIGVIGPNGAGKTTLLRVILDLARPDRGQVRLAGRPVRRGRSDVGYVPQIVDVDPDLPLRARDLVALGIDGHRWGFSLPNRARRRKVDEALEWVGAAHYADKPVGRVSGGERQRLMIAQALVSSPRVLLLDEPLAGLDIRSQGEIVHLVHRINRERGVTVLLVAHDMNPILPVMDGIVYVARGRVATGTVAEVVRPEVLGALYGYDVEVIETHGRILVVGSGDAVSSEVGGHGT